jgi:hypothetical protein
MPSATITAAIPADQCMAETNASFAAPMTGWPAGPSRSATPYAPEIDELAASRIGSGRPAVADSTCER